MKTLLLAVLLGAAVPAFARFHPVISPPKKEMATNVSYMCAQHAQAWSYATMLRNAGVPWRRADYLVSHHDDGGYTQGQIDKIVHRLDFDPKLAGAPSQVVFNTIFNECRLACTSASWKDPHACANGGRLWPR